MESHGKALFSIPVVRPVTTQELNTLADDLGLRCTHEELEGFKEYMNDTFTDSYEYIYKMVSPTLPVKYPRTPGYRPEREENVHNAWYWKCDIKGAHEGPLKGKKVAIKDNTCVAGVHMCNGSSVMEGYIPDVDATVVTRILDAGGNIVGKASCEYLCLSASSWTSISGPTLNPLDVTRTAGGSSGGSVVLVQTGEVDMAIGGDQGGSIRIPCSWCGLVGLKPTWGLVPYTGAVPIEVTLDHLGTITRSVEDCAVFLEAIAGYDNGFDPRQPRDLQVPQYTKCLTSDMTGKKVGLVKEGFAICDEDVQTIVRAAAFELRQAGADVEEISIPLHAHGQRIRIPVRTEGTYKCLVQGNGNGYHWKGLYVESMQKSICRGLKSKVKDFPDTMKYLYLFGEYISKNYGNKFYGKCQNLTILLTRAYDEALSKFDVLIMPTLPFIAPKLPVKNDSVKERMKKSLGMLVNTSPFNSTGHPALSINAGYSEGLPVGMMIIGKHFDEMSVLQAAYAFEKLGERK